MSITRAIVARCSFERESLICRDVGSRVSARRRTPTYQLHTHPTYTSHSIVTRIKRHRRQPIRDNRHNISSNGGNSPKPGARGGFPQAPGAEEQEGEEEDDEKKNVFRSIEINSSCSAFSPAMYARQPVTLAASHKGRVAG